MNILMFTRCMGAGGTEKVILQLCEALNMSGNKVIVCAASGNGVEKLNEKKIKYYEIPDIQSKKTTIAINVIKTILKIINDEKIDIVHTHHRMAAFYMCIIKRLKHIKTINTIHNTFDDKRKLTKFAFDSTENIAVGNSVFKNMTEHYKISPKKIRIIYNAIDNSNVKYENIDIIEQYSKEFFLVGNIGRINTQKGFECYVQAADRVKKMGYPIKFFIIGDGVLRKKIEDIVTQRNLSDIVIFTGFQKNILNVIDKLDLMVLSSLWEGFPLTPIETFSMGKTIVATDVPGTVEIVQDDINGIIVPINSDKAIAEGIVRLFKDKALKEKYEKNAKKTYNEKFSYPAFCKNYLTVYNSL